MSTTPAPEWLLATPIAHRGLHDAGARPENSAAAFDAAAAAGFPIELDVRLSSDGRVVVFHDVDLARLTGRPGRVADAPASDLSRMRLLDTAETVPLLADVLALVDDRVPLLIEVKNEGEGGPIAHRVADAIAEYNGRVAVQTFHAPTLAELARLAPGVARGYLFNPPPGAGGNGADAAADAIVAAVRDCDASFAGCNVRGLPYPPVLELSEEVALLGWTVTSASVEREARRYCDNVIFEGYLPDRS